MSVYLTDVSEKVCVKRLAAIISGNNNLFVVSGGPVEIVEIIGIVRTVIQDKSCVVGYNFDPTLPATDTAFASTGLEIRTDAADTLYTWSGVECI